MTTELGAYPVILPIHPSNFRLFPNLGSLWKNSQQFSFHDLRVSAQPTASTLVSGTYVVASIASS